MNTMNFRIRYGRRSTLHKEVYKGMLSKIVEGKQGPREWSRSDEAEQFLKAHGIGLHISLLYSRRGNTEGQLQTFRLAHPT
jgi:hypothetical protein